MYDLAGAAEVPKAVLPLTSAIASYLGTKLSSLRMVGWAMNASFQVKPRCRHNRLINRNGQLSEAKLILTPPLIGRDYWKEGYPGKEWITVVDFQKLFWGPTLKSVNQSR